ncbi:hypothetical protein ACFVIM_03030 [Streptomyces sp. NPDC057638]|uniref:hypothetical protein n=1 Tax=Streptomyces sp. NPDC057638 TaxID=3346190 RepID=UPI00368DFBAE
MSGFLTKVEGKAGVQLTDKAIETLRGIDVEVSANARHHSPGYTMTRYGRRRAEGAKKLAASSASRINLGWAGLKLAGARVTLRVTQLPHNAKNPR